MKVFLSADMEGTCGIADWSETERTTPQDYAPYQKQMTREVAAACRGALSAGAEEVFVKDAHDYARNILPEELPEQIKISRGWSGDPLSMMSGLDHDDFGAVLFTGYHAWVSCPGNPLSHTMNLQNDFVTLNGEPLSEFQINALTAGYYGVPVTFLSGDKALCEFAESWIPGITTVAVNEGFGASACSIHPNLAVRLIEEGAKESLAHLDECQVPMPEYFECAVRFREHKKAFAKSFYPGALLDGSKTVCYQGDDWFEMLRFFHFVLSDG